MKKPEIKHCPFCGGDELVVINMLSLGIIVFAVECHDCDCIGPMMEKRKDAIKSWNDRAFS